MTNNSDHRMVPVSVLEEWAAKCDDIEQKILKMDGTYKLLLKERNVLAKFAVNVGHVIKGVITNSNPSAHTQANLTIFNLIERLGNEWEDHNTNG